MPRPFSCALYPSDFETARAYLDLLAAHGCREVFTSLHLPETDDRSQYDFLSFLLQESKSRGMKVCADLGGKGLQKGLADPDKRELLARIDKLRLDYGYDSRLVWQIHEALPQVQLVINASSLCLDQIEALCALNIPLEACHNFYPRPESGLSLDFVQKQNRIFKSRNIPVTFCIPVHDCPRGPLKEGLPTLEAHRNQPLEAVLIQCLRENLADSYLFADPYLSSKSLQAAGDYLSREILEISYEPSEPRVPEEQERIQGSVHYFRYDSPDCAWRSATSRQMASQGAAIEPRSSQARPAGSVTLDNSLYGRYSGELQVLRQDLPADKRVNVAGFVKSQHLARLDLAPLGFGYRFKETGKACSFKNKADTVKKENSMVNLNNLQTETPNEKTQNLDTLSALEIVTLMNQEDARTIEAVNEALDAIAAGVQLCQQALEQGGRMIYIGAGTSGRLGVIDAAECAPTFSTDKVLGLIAGGPSAIIKAAEGAEDSRELGEQDLKSVGVNEKDVVIGMAASGRTPYVIGALDYARSQKAGTISVSCNKNAALSSHADVAIEVNAGPEVLTGSTRLKSGTCQKMICNMLSTASMVLNGKVYKNLMVDMKPSNEKLEERAVRILMEATGAQRSVCEQTLAQANGSMKAAILMIVEGIDFEQAQDQLEKSKGKVRTAIENAQAA